METNLNSMPISTLNEQFTLGNVNLQPKYQRRLVWPFKSKVYLIDTILQGLPLPKFFMQLRVDPLNGKTIYDMVDGQQRLSTIFQFIREETNDGKQFILSRKHHPKPETFLSDLEGLTFSTLPSSYQQKLWLYKLTMEELTNATEQEIRDMFVRLNLNNVKLKDQELRNAIFHGDFKKVVYSLSDEYEEDFYLKYKILSLAQIKRMNDAEMTSELLGFVLRGLTNKKDKLDEIYRENDSMEEADIKSTKSKFRKIMNLIETIMGEDLRTTRFNNRTDFQSIFYLLYTFIYEDKLKIPTTIYSSIKEALIEVSLQATKEAVNPQLLEYYIKTVNAGDTIANRKYRHEYLKNLLSPMCIKRDKNRLFNETEKQYLWHKSESKSCGICNKIISNYEDCEIDHIESWDNGGRTDIVNGQISHSRCNKQKSNK